MNFTRQEIEKIRVMFQDTNIECDKLTKEKEYLRITYQALQDDTRSYNRKIKQINKECKELIKENKHLFNEEDFLICLTQLNLDTVEVINLAY